MLKAVHKKFHGKAGIRTIKMYLEFKFGIVMNTKKIARLKNVYKIETRIRRKNRFNISTRETQKAAAVPNLLNREFKQHRPDQVYVTDITYLPYRGGKHAFLSAVKDLGSREIVHHKISQNIDMQLAYDGLENTFKKLTYDQRNRLILHSDQGFHYRNSIFKNLLKEYGVVQSMSRKGNCIDNAPIESFFGHMKDEIDLKRCKNFNEVKEMVTRYIDYYNNERPQWTLKKMTPAQYRCHLNS